MTILCRIIATPLLIIGELCFIAADWLLKDDVQWLE